MLESVKGRSLEEKQIVQVYRNLHKGSLFSVRDKKTGLVVAHGDRFLLKNVTCKVSVAGRSRVLKEKRKNVHAVLEGEFNGCIPLDPTEIKPELYYNPYQLEHFINRNTKESVHQAKQVYCYQGKVFLISL